jgi:CIC family chloride channel protein
VLLAGDLADRLPLPGPVKTALAGLAVGLVALQVPEILGIGGEVLRSAMTEHVFAAADLALILVAKLLLTALCLGFGFAGGVFSPALFIGVLFGALVGTGAETLFGGEESHIAIYAVCGMVAVTGPVIGAPLTMILIVFELTQNYELATASMLSVAFANLVGYRVFGRSLFDVQLAARGLDFAHGRGKAMAQQRPVRALISDEFTSVGDAATLAEVRDALVRDRRREAYLVDEDGRYVGTLTLHRAMELLAEDGAAADADAAEHAQPEALILEPGDSIWEAMQLMHESEGDSIPVVENGVLLGVVFESRVISAYVETLHEVRREEHAGA